MSKLGLTLLVLSIASVAAAQPKPASGFAKATTFGSCSTSWAFACGKRDAQGNTFGTAHEMKHCEKYTFQPNGTYSLLGDMAGASYGTYKMIGSTVRITPTFSDGTKGQPFDVVLSAEGATLGSMKRL